MVFIFPLVATAVSFVFAALLLKQYIDKKKAYQFWWGIALVMFGLASLAETVATYGEWNDLLVRVWYTFGATLVVGYLALGSLYVADPKTSSRLLSIGVILAFLGPVLPMVIFSDDAVGSEKLIAASVFGVISLALIILSLSSKEKTPIFWLGALILGTIGGLAMAFTATIDQNLVAIEGWEAMQRPLIMKATVAYINTLGTVVLAGGALYSAYSLMKKNIMRERAIGTILIGIGAIFPALGGFLSGYFKVADIALLSISLTLGITIMFIGFLQTSRPSKTAPQPKVVPT